MNFFTLTLFIFNFNAFAGLVIRDTTCESATVTCLCGKDGKKVTIPVEQCATSDGRICKPCESESAICNTFANCHECSPELTNRCLICPQARGGMMCDEILGCQTLLQPTNGDVHPFGQSAYGFKEGEEVRYSCYKGFSLTGGSLTRVCRRDGTWSGVEPICIPNNGREQPKFDGKQCPSPLKIQNGQLNLKADTVTYSCDPNFTLVGNRQLFCENNKWSNSPPHCESKINNGKTCPAVEPVARAKVELILNNVLIPTIQRTKAESANKMLGPYPDGTQLLYSCESNFYSQSGPKIRTCKNGQWTGRAPICTPICGQSNTPRAPLIINGTVSEIGQWPWAVVIRRKEGGQWEFKCGGSLITERMVLTAAHCVTHGGLKETFPSDVFKLFVGKHFLDDAKDDREVQVRTANEIFVHSDYNPFSLDSDIGLISVTTSFQLTIRVQPVCLPEPHGIELRSINGNVGTVIGWGYTEKETVAPQLINLRVPIVSTEKCREVYKKKRITVTDNMICAGYEEGGRDTCSGDSGGALMLPLDKSEQKWFVEGVVSWGGAPDSECAEPGQYGSYVKVRNYIDWINQFMFSK